MAAAEFAGPAYYTISYPLAMAAVLIVALNMGPPLKRWQLTGHHRIAPLRTSDSSRVQL